MDGQGFAVSDNSQVGQGTHLIGEWYGCDFSKEEAIDAVALRTLCLSLTKDAGLDVVGDVFHQFEPQGVTGTVLLAESHLAIHTWPEGTLSRLTCTSAVISTKTLTRRRAFTAR